VHIEHRARVAAPLETIFDLACDVEAWPELLREYRWCRILDRTPQRVVFSMGGWIRGWPARWTAVQEPYPSERRITFRHIGGITKGMEVEWRFASVASDPSQTPAGHRQTGEAVDVAIVHDLVMPWPLIGRLVSDLIVGPIFIDYIARRTLAAVKTRAESDGRNAA
jgi:hypothetical protein